MDHERVELVGACRRTGEDHLGTFTLTLPKMSCSDYRPMDILRRACSLRPSGLDAGRTRPPLEKCRKGAGPGGRPVATSQIERIDNGGRGRIAGTMNRVAPRRHLTSHRGEFLVAVPRIFCAHASFPFSLFPCALFPSRTGIAPGTSTVPVRRPGPGQMYLPCPEDVLHTVHLHVHLHPDRGSSVPPPHFTPYERLLTIWSGCSSVLRFPLSAARQRKGPLYEAFLRWPFWLAFEEGKVGVMVLRTENPLYCNLLRTVGMYSTVCTVRRYITVHPTG
jgi:hypothetical protein